MALIEKIIQCVVEVYLQLMGFASISLREFVETILKRESPTDEFWIPFQIGLLIGMIFFLRHDLLSQIASLLRCLTDRKKPTAVDEKIPTLWLLTLSLSFLYLFVPIEWQSLFPRGTVLLSSGVLIVLTHRFSKQKKQYYDWNWKDAGLLGISQAAGLAFGFHPLAVAFFTSRFSQFSIEAIYPFSLYPYLGLLLFQFFQSPTSIHSIEWSWVSYLYLFLSGIAVFALLQSLQSIRYKIALERIGYFQIILGLLVTVYFWS